MLSSSSVWFVPDLGQMSFQLYSGGVLTANCGTNLDHGVLLVGYGVSVDGIKYWKASTFLPCVAWSCCATNLSCFATPVL